MKYGPLILIVAALVVPACSGDRAPDSFADALAADSRHYSLERENDAVRILRAKYGAGESSKMHAHPAHCFVALDSGTFSMAASDGSTSALSTILGQVGCVEPTVHRPKNTGNKDTSVVLVEFKEGAVAPAPLSGEFPGAVEADPGHYSVAFENDVARLLHARYGAGAESVMHHHPAHCFVALGSSEWLITGADGSVAELSTSPGQVECIDAGAHKAKNVTGRPVEIILVELKGRPAFGD